MKVQPQSSQKGVRAQSDRGAAPLTLAITGGKGGVGKTQVALNLALVLARQGHRTLLLDGDVELANVNVMLGMYPGMTLEHVVLGERTLEEVLLPVTENLDLLPGASGVPNCLDLRDSARDQFLHDLNELEQQYDTVIIDTAAGLNSTGLHMVAASHLAALVITPDPTSMTDAFSVLKVLQSKGYRRTPSIIVNMALGATQAQGVYRRFSAAVSRYIGMQTHYLGAIWRDETIAQSITTQRPVAMMDPDDPSCRQFWTLADMLSVRCSQGVPPANGFSRYWARLLRRRSDRRRAREKEQGRVPSEAGEWLSGFRRWLAATQDDSLARYRMVTGALELLGQNLDEDTVEALQTGLAGMNWDDASPATRNAAAAHFQQLAQFVAPPQGTRPEEAQALSASMPEPPSDGRNSGPDSDNPGGGSGPGGARGDQSLDRLLGQIRSDDGESESPSSDAADDNRWQRYLRNSADS